MSTKDQRPGDLTARRGSRAGVVAAVLMTLALQACASATGVLRPMAATVAGAHTQSILAVTTRAPSARPGVLYSGARALPPSAVIVDVSLPPTHRTGRLEWPRHAKADPTREFTTQSVVVAEHPTIQNWFAAQRTGGRVLIFVHGYNVSFETAVYRLAQIANDARIKAAPVLFSWPSEGKVFAYVYDKESANYSRDALEQTLRAAVDSPSVTDVTILAHSMGTWVAMEALRQSAIRDGHVSPKIKNVIFAAPDLDIDVFGTQFQALGPDRPHFTLLISREDRALRVSRLLAGGVQRVGAVNAQSQAVRAGLAQIDGVTVLDLSKIKDGDKTGHSTFASSPEVVQLLGEQFINGPALSGPHAATTPVSSFVLDVAETLTAGAKK